MDWRRVPHHGIGVMGRGGWEKGGESTLTGGKGEK